MEGKLYLRHKRENQIDNLGWKIMTEIHKIEKNRNQLGRKREKKMEWK